ncbi:hypothetical protein OXB_3124 [Bacillus sp. OxB-1]|uniref:prepilin-type N-terminal cleavage/methylation domain-containing protein n=1 Tax=Bacillus sp. (strain OxB-1) TaxID=98228 RepID=UPI0005820FAB|nr:prepilin-type N-terminal cleavage/methylation domain-containing protein [Bacillus sp. OxB-1]BAQ11593.1 hypothetical protein OXB_3124 [Bacillus sp. OxB-1]
MSNEKGITLVELLASLALLSMVVILIWTTFFITARYNIAETTKLQLQQEANYILTTIQQQHRYKECYNLKVEGQRLVLEDCDTGDRELVSSGFDYTLNPEEIDNINPDDEDLHFILSVKDPKEGSKLKVKVETTISRYRP